MRPFDSLTHLGRLRRIRTLARAALARWPITPTDVHLINHGENTTYRVTDAAGGRWILRIHRQGYHDAPNIRSELGWLDSLRADGLDVPNPLPGHDGQTLQTVAIEGIPKPRHCVLFGWMTGRFLRKGIKPRNMHQFGAVTARLHRNATVFSPPTGFVRHRRDADGTMGPNGFFGDPTALEELTPEETAILIKARDRAQPHLEALFGHDPAHFGLIHGDMHRWNVLFEDERAKVIDFDDCGFGYFLVDAVVALRMVDDRPNYADFKAAWLAGYRTERPLDQALFDEALPSLAIMDRLLGIAWVQSRRDLPWMIKVIPRVKKGAIEGIEKVMRGESVL